MTAPAAPPRLRWPVGKGAAPSDLRLRVGVLGELVPPEPETIVARTADPIPTPDGRWLRFYTLADGSVQHYSTETPNQAFTGNWQLQSVKSRP